MIGDPGISAEGRALVGAVRTAAQQHEATWESLVPDAFTIDLTAEQAEEDAFQDMAVAKRALRDHICRTYGISARELCSLAII